MKLKTLIIDDESHCRTALERTIKDYCPQLEITCVAASVCEARKSYHEARPDLIFLDVEMPEESGFDFLDQIGSKTPVIFTTAHESYALKALKKRALDFLLKPVSGKDLIEAVNKLEKPISDNKLSQNKVALPSLQGLLLLEPEEIIRCEADGAYTKVYAQGKSYLISRNIGFLEKRLIGSGFFRVHKSHLINLGHLCEYIKGNGGVAIMRDGSKVDVSKRKRVDFLLSLMR